MIEKEQPIYKKFLNYIAFGISTVFSPYVIAAIFIVVITYIYAQNLRQFLPWMAIAFFFALVIPGSYLLWLLEAKKIDNIHISELKARKLPFLITGFSALVGAVVLYLVDASRPVVVMAAAYALNAMAVALITQVWKISIHMAMYSALSTIALILFGPNLWWLYLLLLPLGWARIYRRRHTLWQVIAGALLAFILSIIVFWFFGYQSWLHKS